jgi:integrase
MARSIRNAQLETRTARLRLPIRGKPYNARIAKGLRLCYRRNKIDGTWNRLYKGELKVIGLADDFQDADGTRVLTFDQAVARCRQDVYGADESVTDGDRPVTLDQAVTAYEADLVARDGGRKNATWLRSRTPADLLKKALSAIDAKDFRRWRDDLIAEGKLQPGTINRLRAAVFACCNNQKKLDARVRDTWSIGWPLLPNARKARNVVLTEAEIRALVNAAYGVTPEFGLFTEMAATTGSRPSQLARLTCADIATDAISMPASRKGSRKRRTAHRPLPLPPALAKRLREIAVGRPADAPLLVQAGHKGGPWAPGAHSQPFRDAATAAGLDPAVVTIYALRHSFITSSLLRNVPIRLIAAACDTSVAMIEHTYAAYILNHGDAMLRAGMLDLSERADDAGNVVPLRGDRSA